MRTGWQNIKLGNTVHVIPMNDEKPHTIFLNCLCECQPSTDPFDKNVVIHKAFDERELVEDLSDRH